MSDRQNSLKPVVERTPYSPFTRPLRGSVNYRWSVLRAPLVAGVGQFIPGSTIKLALFVQDVPVLLSADSEYPATDFGVAAMPPFNFVEPGVSLVSTLGTTGDLQSVSTVAAGEVSRVRLVTANLIVPAYAASLLVTNRDLIDGEDPATCGLYLSVITESGVVAGVPAFFPVVQSTDNPVTAGVIIPSTLYTQAIRDNDNLWVLSGGQVTYTVVGVYEAIAP